MPRTFVEVGVLGTVQTERTERTALRIQNVFLQGPAQDGIGNFVFLIGCLNSILSHTYVWKILRHETIQQAKRWNQSFSPLEVGKQWFYTEIQKRWELLTLQGWETKEIRDRLGLKKSPKKLSEMFEAHCVDSWCLAYHAVGGESVVENRNIFCIFPIPIQRRTLHREQPKKGGIRSRYGGTVLANGLIKHTLVKHVKHGLTRLAGINAKGLFAIYDLDGKRLTTSAKQNSFKVLTRLNFNYRSGHSSLT